MRHHPEIPDAASATGDGVTIAATTTEVLAANTDRASASIVASPSNTETVWIKVEDDAVMNEGIPLVPGGAYNIGTNNFHTMAVNGICASGGQVVGVSELSMT